MSNPETLQSLLDLPRISSEIEQSLLETMHNGIDFAGVQADLGVLKELYKPTKQDRLPDTWGVVEEAYRLNATQESVDAHDEILLANIRLVWTQAVTEKNGQVGYIDEDDIFAAALSSASQAIWEHTPDSEFKLSTRIAKAVQWERVSVIAAHGFAVRLPAVLVNHYKHFRLWMTKNHLMPSQIQGTTLDEFAGVRAIGTKQATSIIRAGNLFWEVTPLYGDSRFSDYTDLDGQPTSRPIVSNKADMIHDEAIEESFEEEFMWGIEESVLIDAMQKLRERDRLVVEMVVGMTDGESYNLTQVGEVFGLSRERIRQIYSRGLSVLRSDPKVKALQDDNIRPTTHSITKKSPEYLMRQDMAQRTQLKNGVLTGASESLAAKPEVDKFEALRQAQSALHAWGDLKVALGYGGDETLTRIAELIGFAHGCPDVTVPAVKDFILGLAYELQVLIHHRDALMSQKHFVHGQERGKLFGEIHEIDTRIDQFGDEVQKQLASIANL